MNRAGVVGTVVMYGRRLKVAGCADCEQVKPILCRGLCVSCWSRHDSAGTLANYGYTAADRRRDFARFRRGGLSIAEAAARVGVTYRSGQRYEARLHPRS